MFHPKHVLIKKYNFQKHCLVCESNNDNNDNDNDNDNDNHKTFEFKKHVSTETSVIFS